MVKKGPSLLEFCRSVLSPRTASFCSHTSIQAASLAVPSVLLYHASSPALPVRNSDWSPRERRCFVETRHKWSTGRFRAFAQRLLPFGLLSLPFVPRLARHPSGTRHGSHAG